MQQWKKTTFKQPQNFTNILKYVHERLVQKNVFEFQIMILQERITLELDLDVCQRAIPPQKMDCPTLNAIYPITSIDLASPNVSYELSFFTRWMREISPADLCDVPSGVCGHTRLAPPSVLLSRPL